jgi:hypothetical protein
MIVSPSPLLAHGRPLLAPRMAPAAMNIDAMVVDAAASAHASLGDVSTTLAFADQAGNLAGALFPLSLPSYLLFLYFLGYEGNRCPKTAQFGSQILLLFVVSTVVTGMRAPPLSCTERLLAHAAPSSAARQAS